jgi:hypothetical protein
LSIIKGVYARLRGLCETHHWAVHRAQDDGFREELNPSYKPGPTAFSRARCSA